MARLVKTYGKKKHHIVYSESAAPIILTERLHHSGTNLSTACGNLATEEKTPETLENGENISPDALIGGGGSIGKKSPIKHIVIQDQLPNEKIPDDNPQPTTDIVSSLIVKDSDTRDLKWDAPVVEDLSEALVQLSLTKEPEPSLPAPNDPPVIESFAKLTSICQLTAKIGEASYSDVYSGTLRNPKRPVAIKVIPVGGEDQLTYDQSVIETLSTSSTSTLVKMGLAFIELISSFYVRGYYPKRLQSCWDTYDAQIGSENEDPGNYPSQQLYLILVLEFAGKDLEHALIPHATAAKSILVQIVYSLAVAEQEVMFEHRDLHWGNVMIQKRELSSEEEGYLSFTDPYYGAKLKLDPGAHIVKMIDFTLSRLTVNGTVNYCVLEDDLFTGTGEELEAEGGDLQFDIYRWMRTETGGNWSEFYPKTNVQWLYYLVDKLIRKKDIRSKDLADFKSRILDYPDIQHVLLHDIYFNEAFENMRMKDGSKGGSE